MNQIIVNYLKIVIEYGLNHGKIFLLEINCIHVLKSFYAIFKKNVKCFSFSLHHE